MVGCLLVKIQQIQENDSVGLVMQQIARKLDTDLISKKNDWIIAYAQMDSKIPVWQLAFELEVSGKVVGYGFGSTFQDAKNDVFHVLSRRVDISLKEYQIQTK